MDTNTFYAVTSATCFTLVGLWWSVVNSKPEWMKDEAKKRLAGGVYASFLIPALMSLGAQVGGTNHLIWQFVFIIAAGAGITFSSRLIQLTRTANGAFSRTAGWSRSYTVLFCSLLYFPIWQGILGWSRFKWRDSCSAF